MERKSMGQFIAALRRVSGMTQKQLAEKLNVSDKAVSRWERDECAPDLTLIPVIAEIFNITSDELLRGERNNNEEVMGNGASKTEKQVKHIINSALLSFKIRSIISLGVALLGIVAAMICNFGFLRAYIGFFCGMIFVIASVACQLIFGMKAFFVVNGDEFDRKTVVEYKLSIIKGLEITFSAIAAVFVILLPLIIEPWDTYMGISVGSWFAEGAIFVVISGVLSFFVCLLLNIKLANDYNIEEVETIAEKKRIITSALKKLAILVGVTVLLQFAFNIAASFDIFAETIKFESTEEFKKFMETPMDWDGNTYALDVYENETSQWYIFDREGNEIDTYYEWNESVSSVSYDWEKGDPLYIVYTHSAMLRQSHIIESVNTLFVIAYVVEILIVILIGTKRFRKI
ncbi:MAG: helix-turn-helix transcriptional regulator [Clostridia bacterium]|nr:helix-turn-helix transcriptional regulator [Clostridia bacterium]